jgi:G:T/U-mismatch repair DNA glycosylase
MPLHRFIQDLLHLEQNPIRGDYNTLIIGTFNAEDQEGLNNDAEWFYGRARNQFWYILPQLFGQPSLHRKEHQDIPLTELASLWKQFCVENSIVIIDIFKEIEGVLPNHGDNAIANAEDVNLFNYELAFQNATFQNVIFTWKGQNDNTGLGVLKTLAHNWFTAQGSQVYHMVSPSPAFRRSREWKLSMWLEMFNENYNDIIIH